MYTSIYLLLTGEVEILDGLSSQADQVAQFKDNDNSNIAGLVPLESASGFYVRVKKPVNKGRFTFIYGVHQEVKEKAVWPNISK